MSLAVHHLIFLLQCMLQAIGAGSMINEQCKNFVRQYVPQILHLIDTMPPEQVQFKLNTIMHNACVNMATPPYQAYRLSNFMVMPLSIVPGVRLPGTVHPVCDGGGARCQGGQPPQAAGTGRCRGCPAAAAGAAATAVRWCQGRSDLPAVRDGRHIPEGELLQHDSQVQACVRAVTNS